LHIAAYGICSLTDAERKWSTTGGVFCSGLQMVTVLLGAKFEVVANHQALSWMFGRAEPPMGKLARWVLKMQPFQPFAGQSTLSCCSLVKDVNSHGRPTVGGVLSNSEHDTDGRVEHCPKCSGLVGEVKVVAFPRNSNSHILGIPTGDVLHSVLNKYGLPSSLVCALSSSAFTSNMLDSLIIEDFFCCSLYKPTHLPK